MQTLSAEFTSASTGNRFPHKSATVYKHTNVSFFEAKKNVMFIFWNFSCKWTILLKDKI
jgi:hypothetical protein